LDKRLGGPQSRSGRGEDEKNLLALPVIEHEFSGRPARSPSLYRLSYAAGRGALCLSVYLQAIFVKIEFYAVARSDLKR
jgi:hypothetical protein